jgi:DNA-binding MarR family transcriptional regulator
MTAENRVENIGYLATDVARLMRNVFDVRVKGLGLTRSRWRVLAYLLRRDGMTQSELADELEISKASLGPLLDSLERQGWLRREEDERDRRAKRIYLTDRVQPILAEMNAVGAELHRQALAGLDPTARRQLAAALGHVKSNLVLLNADLQVASASPAPAEADAD